MQLMSKTNRSKEEEIQFARDMADLINWTVESVELGLQTGLQRHFSSPLDMLLSIIQEIAVTNGATGDAAAFKRELDTLDKSKLH